MFRLPTYVIPVVYTYLAEEFYVDRWKSFPILQISDMYENQFFN